MTNLYGRLSELYVDSLKFSSEDLYMLFEITFDNGTDTNVSTVSIYNLSGVTLSKFKRGSKIILNAGYTDDIGVISLGLADRIETTWDNNIDKITKITIADASDNWFSTDINLTFGKGVYAKDILNKIMQQTGLQIGAFNLPVNKQYLGGKTIKSKLGKAIIDIGADCGAKVHITKGKVYIRPKNEGDNFGVVIDAMHGLIESPQPIQMTDTYKTTIKTTINNQAYADKKGVKEGWRVKTLLNHGITTDSIITVKSRTANGVFKVEKGRHVWNGNDFYTEMDVFPV